MWYVDSEATQHMCHELEGFVKYIKHEDKQVVYLGDDTTLYIIEGHGDVNIKFINGDEKIIPNVLHISRLIKDLFSVKLLEKTGGEIRIRASTTTPINKFCQTIAICKLNLDLYELGTTILSNKPQIAIPTTTQLNKADLWHLRLGHINPQRLKQIQTMAKGIDSFDERKITLYQPCIEDKQHKEKFPTQAHVFIPKETRKKLDSHSQEALFLGYSEESKVYRLMNIQSQQILISRDVLFNENLHDLQTTPYLQKDNEELVLDLELLKHLSITKKTNEQILPSIQGMSFTSMSIPQETHVFDQSPIHSIPSNVGKQPPSHINVIEDFCQLSLQNDQDLTSCR
uniref:Uncharacterized protein n=1 Tax=Physcomitrium patens TaxID=3218 RepID=A0A2K1K8J1_PHYPA|nr:hypothetical protein PHYPA_011990 [Physcomitrium patens]